MILHDDALPAGLHKRKVFDWSPVQSAGMYNMILLG